MSKSNKYMFVNREEVEAMIEEAFKKRSQFDSECQSCCNQNQKDGAENAQYFGNCLPEMDGDVVSRVMKRKQKVESLSHDANTLIRKIAESRPNQNRLFEWISFRTEAANIVAKMDGGKDE